MGDHWAKFDLERKARHAAQDVDHYHALQEPDGGFSFNPHTGKSPTKRYMVSIGENKGATNAVHDLGKLKPSDLAAHRQKVDSLLTDPENFQGGWHDPADHKVYLDVSRQYDDLGEAGKAAVAGHQIAIFDNKTFNSIPTEDIGKVIGDQK